MKCRGICVVAVACFGVGHIFRSPAAFLPPCGQPARGGMQVAAAVGGAASIFAAVPSAMAAPEADPLDIAARKFADASYTVMQQVDWKESPQITKYLENANWEPEKLAVFLKAVLADGEAMNPALIARAVSAHRRAIQATQFNQNENLLAPQPEVEEVFQSVARMIASAGPERSQAVYKAAADLGFTDLYADFYKSVKASDSDYAYRSFLETITAALPKSGASKALAPTIDETSKKFADASYPLFQKIDWVKTPQFTKWLKSASAGWSPQKLNIAIDKVLEDAMAMDPGLIRKAVEAHETAISHAATNPKLIAPITDIEDIFAALAKMISSAGSENNLAVYDAVAALGVGSLNADMYNMIGTGDAATAYKAFLETMSAARAR